MWPEAPTFALFWENSKLNPRTGEAFARDLERDARTAAPAAQLLFPSEDLRLPRPTDALADLMRSRVSRRELGPRPLSERQLGALFHAFSETDSWHRMVPSAGGKYPVEVFAFLFRVEGALAGRAVYYNSDHHSLSAVGACPPWAEARGALGMTAELSPAAMFAFVGWPGRVLRKYGERGGRFLLIEVGHYAQNLGLRVAAEKLAGYEVGGLHDDRVRALLGLEGSDAAVALGYAVGAPLA